MSSLVPSEVSLLQKFSVNKLLENFSYDLIFPMDLPTDPGSMSEKKGKLQPLRTSFPFDEANQFDESASTTPSSIQSDYSSFPGTKLSSINSHSVNNNTGWYSSRPNISQPDNFQDKSLLFSPPKRYLSDSNLNSYPFGSGNGDMSPLENSSMYCNQNLSSPFKCNDRNGGVLDFDPYHTRSSMNLNYGGNTPVQKAEKPTMYSSDILNNLLALNSSNSAESYAANMKGLEQTMRMLQTQQHQQQNHHHGGFMESRTHSSNHSYNRQSSMGSSAFSRQNSGSGEESIDFRQSTSYNNMSGGLSKYPSGTNTSSSCSSIEMNAHSCSSSSQMCSGANAVRTWNGIIPTRTSKAITYSQKVFLGGIPWETSEETLKHIFSRFGPLRVEWPGKDPNYSTKPKGCVYIIFENEKQVRDLLASCQLVRDRHVACDDGKFFYKFPWKNMKTKNVEVIPWNIADSNYVSSSQILDPSKTIFVGALHGKLTAEGLALIMNDLFDGVVYAGIDTDKHKYPLGAGRVTFNNPQSYMKAIQTGYLLIKTPIFTKKVQIDPYLEDNLCSSCNIHHGPYYCRELSCFRYFCRVCWQLQHNDGQRSHHRPLTRNSKSQSIVFND